MNIRKWITEYSSVVVLLGLMVYYSIATITEQRPITPRAARQVAQVIAATHGADAAVMVAVGDSRQETLYAETLAEQLRAAGLEVRSVVTGSVAEIRQELESLGRQGVRLQAVATHRDLASSLPFLRPDGFRKLAEQYPSLRETRIYKPGSYRWPSFLTSENLLNVLNQNAGIAIIAIGMTLVIITGGIDLSVGSVLALAAVSAAIVMQRIGGAAGMAVGCLAGFAVCSACGLATGLTVTRFRVPAFIVTLSMMMACRGLAFIGAVQYHSAASGGGSKTPEAIRIDFEQFGLLANGRLLGVPNPVWIMVALYLLAHVVMSRTVFGRHVYAVGGNALAARLSGIRVDRVLTGVYIISALTAGLAGLIDASRFVGGRPNAGELYELKVIAAVVVGGASLFGGQGRVFGTLVGALIIAVIENGLNIEGVTTYEQMVVFGGLILAASLLDQFKHRAAGAA
ncbi:MAG: ABC transporter permease [Planctomycetales bacterium]|nr:ABC transporter permease [Planctomycetales bacterium]